MRVRGVNGVLVELNVQRAAVGTAAEGESTSSRVAVAGRETTDREYYQWRCRP